MERERLLMIKLHKLFNLLPRGRDSQGRILKIVTSHDGISQKQLQQILEIQPGSLSEVISKLENLGYVERRHGENDRRVVMVYATDAGREAYKLISAEHAAAGKDFFKPLNEGEQEQLLLLFNKLLEGKCDHHKHEAKQKNISSQNLCGTPPLK